MVDCRSLIEFCRTFEEHQKLSDSVQSRGRRIRCRGVSGNKKKHSNLNPMNNHPFSFCHHSSVAAMDIIILFVVLGALGLLTFPSLRLVLHESSEFFSALFSFLWDGLKEAPLAYLFGFSAAVVLVILTIAVWELLDTQSRKCRRNPYCKGLRKAIEYDIQLESEECVRYLPPTPTAAFGMPSLQLGRDHKELEAELKKMAPVNGRTVLIFRAPCGCPVGRMEVWGAKKVRGMKK